jgi:LacI family transcriptional regulator
MRTDGKATIKDVAKLSGVGIATVSRVINGNYPVSDAVRAAVWAAIDQLGYRPNVPARSLKTRKSRMVGVVVADLSNLFFMQLVKGFEAELSRYNYSIIIAAHYEDPLREHDIVEMMLENDVAAIVTTTCQPDGAYFRGLAGTGVPIVLVDRVLNDFKTDSVSEDNLDASRRITRHLIEQGHRRIAVVNGTLTVSTSTLRHEGYLLALGEVGIPADPRYIVDAGNGTAFQATTKLLESLPRPEWPTAMYCTNNRRTEDTLHALMARGLSVPGDISVVSYGDISLPWMLETRLTHVDQDLLALGKRAGDLTVRRIRSGGEPMVEILRSEIVLGNSVRSIWESVDP